MELGVYAIIGVGVIVAVAAFSRRLGIAAPIILVLVGVGISFLPGVPEVEVPYELILDVVLPPVLYAAALTVPITDFRRNLAPIASLSIVLVVITALGSGFLLYTLLPHLNLAAGIALGAIISPPDAVAATSIGRRLGLPPRLLTLLEGEGLLNDATALVLLRSALAVVAGGIGTPWHVATDFGYAVVVAVIIGLAAGIVTTWVRSRFTDATLDTAISLIVPFVAFMPAEALNASGVLAVVIAGLYVGGVGPRLLSAQARINERINWGTVQFLLENAVFLAIGLQIRFLVDHVNQSVLSIGASVGIGLLATAALIVIRFAWIVPLLAGMRRAVARREKRLLRQWLWLSYFRAHPVEKPRDARRKRRAEQDYARRRADLDHDRENQIDWRGGIALGWSGMRGVVTLAAAQSLPTDGSVPYRSQLILIAFTVAVASLVVQGGTLPWLIKLLRIPGVDADADGRDVARLLDEVSNAGLKALDDPREALGIEGEIDPDVLERVRQSTFLRSEVAWERVRASDVPLDQRPHQLFMALRRLVVDAEREKLVEEQRLGRYSTRALASVQTMLDLEDTRLRPPRAGH
ncbi:sodium:proton antiporter [Gryllotalpicola kribbensis]|uniref:Sodium:proton antiporter n=1 Tax=Gryllotalpicola kribbensis TaxID=993084 RepID=A0ABP8AMX6_9MICO